MAASEKTPQNLREDTSVGLKEWTDLSNAVTANNTYAYSELTGSGGEYPNTYYIVATNFGFNIPSNATIGGIMVSIKHKASSSGIRATEVKLVKNNVIQSTNRGRDAINIGTTDTTYDEYGASNDLWGETWSADDINNSNFGVAFRYRNNNTSARTVYVDNITITVTWTAVPLLDDPIVSNINYNRAVASVQVLSEGSSNITYCGFCYSTSENPTIEDTVVESELENLSMSEVLASLDPETTYFVRAFAENSEGLAYSSQAEFQTLKKPSNVVSSAFMAAMKAPGREIYIEIISDVETFKSDDKLLSFELKHEGQILKTAMRGIQFVVAGKYSLKSYDVTVRYAVKINGTYEFADLGIYNVKEEEYDVKNDTTKLKAWDRMYELMVTYDLDPINNNLYPITVKDLILYLCNRFDFTLVTETFFRDDFSIEQDFFCNQRVTFRDVLDKIAEVCCAIILFNNAGELEVRNLNLDDVFDTLTVNDLVSLDLEGKFGEVNSLVLARSPQEDNVYEKDDESIEENGLTEIRIENNDILDVDRESYIEDMFLQLRGLEFYKFTANTIGLGYFNVGYVVEVTDKDENIYKGIISSFLFRIDSGGISETIKSEALGKTTTAYELAGTKDKKVLKTEIRVNKNEGTIAQIAQQISSIATNLASVIDLANLNSANLEGLQGSITQILQQIENIQISVAGIGGTNLLKNSVGLKGTVAEWQEFDSNGNLIDENNNCSVVQTTEVSNNTESNSALRIQQQYIKQSMSVIVGETYTFYCRYKSVGAVNLYIAGESDQEMSESEDWTVYKYQFTAKTSTLDLRISNVDVEDGDAYLSDLVLKLGDCAGWTQAPNEVYGSNFKFDKDGFEVSSFANAFKAVLDNEKLTVYDTSGGMNRIVMQVSRDSGQITRLAVNDELKVKRYETESAALRLIPHSAGVFLVIND